MADDTIVYKILTRQAWEAAIAAGRFDGSADDARDGFIHLSSRAQVADTAAKHFRGQADLVLVVLATADLSDGLTWEPSRGGALFPHLYGFLSPGSALSVTPLPLDADGVPMVAETLARC
mgnify:CR=1 FL=1